MLAPTEDPHEKVQVVTALRQDHRARALRVAPVPANVTVREVPVDEVLSPIDRDDRAEATRRDDLAEREEEGRVAEHVSDLEEPALRLGGGGDLEALARCGRDSCPCVALRSGRPESPMRARPVHGQTHGRR